MGEYSGSRAELPKNIRQIGERDEVVRLYVEDYVNTYLKQVYPSGGPGTPGRAAARKFGSTAGGSVPLCGRGAGDGCTDCP